MEFSRSGKFTYNFADGFLSVGTDEENQVGPGFMTVNGGFELVLARQDGMNEPFLAFGRDAGGTGTGTITGAGTVVKLIATNLPDDGPGVVVGRDGVGSLTIFGGRSLEHRESAGAN